MKRSPLKRKTPMRRTGIARKRQRDRQRHVASKYRLRKRDIGFMRWIKQQVCCALELSPCDGSVEADHAGRRGTGRKAHDRTCIPLCELHHTQRASFHGVFRSWDQARMRQWLGDQLLVYQAQYDKEMCMAIKRFFRFEEDVATFYVVATDAEHATRLLTDTGMFSDRSTPRVPSEIDAEKAGRVQCDMSDADPDPGRKIPLSDANIGDWFSSEY